MILAAVFISFVQAGGIFDSIASWGAPPIPDELNRYKPKINKLEADLMRWCTFGTGFDPRDTLKKYRELFSSHNVGIDPKSVQTDCSSVQQVVLPENHGFSAGAFSGRPGRYLEPQPDRHTGFTPPQIDFPDDFDPPKNEDENEEEDDSPKRTKTRGASSNTVMGISALVVLLICVTTIACICYKAGNCVMCNNINCFGANSLKVQKEELTPLPSRQPSYTQGVARSLSNPYSAPPSYHMSAPSLPQASSPLLQNSRDSMEKTPFAGSNWNANKSESGW